MDIELSAADFNGAVVSQTTDKVVMFTSPIFTTSGREISQKLSDIAGANITKFTGDMDDSFSGRPPRLLLPLRLLRWSIA